MAPERIHRKIDRTSEDRERLRRVRETFQAERPGPDEVRASGEYEETTLGEYLNVGRAVAALKQARERAGLSLADVSERSGIDRAAISRLENGQNANPTVATLARYAAALGKRITFGVEDLVETR